MLDSSTQSHSAAKYSHHNSNTHSSYFNKAIPNKEHKMKIEDSFPYQTTDISLTTISNKETVPSKDNEVTEFQFGDEYETTNKGNCSCFANKNTLKMEDININTKCNNMMNDIILFEEESENISECDDFYRSNEISNESMFNSSNGNRCSCLKYSDLFMNYCGSNNSLLASAVKNLYREGNLFIKDVTPFNCFDSSMDMNHCYKVSKFLDWNLNDIKIPTMPTKKEEIKSN